MLYPPPPKRDYRHDGYGDYLFGVSRLSPLKRFDLVLRALAEPIAAGIRCVIAGEGAELAAARRASPVNWTSSIASQFVGRLSDREMIDHLARCRAVVFPPFNEDYGFVTVEAFMCGKPVITCSDSGGPAELVRDGESGLRDRSHARSDRRRDARAGRRSQPCRSHGRSRRQGGAGDDLAGRRAPAVALKYTS